MATLNWKTPGGTIGSINFSDIFMLSIGTEIPANADLNTYKTPGTYYAPDSTRAKTLSNCPYTSSNFKLVVMTGGIAATYLMQYLFAYDSGGGAVIYVRSMGTASAGWYGWERVAFTSDIHAYTAGTGLSLSSYKFSLSTSGATAGSYGPSANASPSHGGTFSVPYVTVDTYGRVTEASTKTITLPADSNTDTKVTSTATEPTSATNWYPICSTANTTTTTTTVKNPELRASVLEGTTSAEGKVEIVLGNSTAAGTAGNKTGVLSLYNNKGKWASVRPHVGDTENRTLYTPKSGGTLVVHATDTAIGGTATPVYISAAGVATAISADVGSATNPVYLDGGTIKKTTYTLGKSVPSDAVFTDHTYSNMTAATASAAGTAGLVPAPAKGKQTSFLRGDGTWVIPTDTTYSVFVKSGSTAAAGLVPKPSTTAGTTHYLREDGTWTVPPDTKYSNFVKSGSTAAAGLVPKPSTTAGTTHYLREDGTWTVPPDTKYSNMTAATASAAGTAGLVPAPAAGKQTSFLRGDGTWVVPTNTTYSAFVKSGSTAAAGLVPKPSTTAGTTKYLREDATWAVPPDTNTTYSAGTAALLTAGTDTTNRVWTAKILSDFVESKCTPGSSIAANGYVKLDSGLIIQWGKYKPTTAGVQTINPFAIEFTSACYSIVFWFAINSSGANGCYPTAEATKNSVTGHFYSVPYYWIAIGK